QQQRGIAGVRTTPALLADQLADSAPRRQWLHDVHLPHVRRRGSGVHDSEFPVAYSQQASTLDKPLECLLVVFKAHLPPTSRHPLRLARGALLQVSQPMPNGLVGSALNWALVRERVVASVESLAC
ncbi:hypothetical protein FOZ63_023129, partial [Perkinsus olseni]